MARLRLREYRSNSGLSTTALEQSEVPFPKFQDCRSNKGAFERRAGMARVLRVTTTATCVDFASGSSQYISIPYDSRVWALGTRFTVEGLLNADSIASTRYILGRANTSPGITIHYESDQDFVVNVWDSSGTNTTVTDTSVGAAGTLIAFRFTRNGANLTLQVNNRTAVTGTMSATLSLRTSTDAVQIGAHNSGTYFDGKIDFLRLHKTVRTTQRDGWSRLLNPRCPTVLADYCLETDANGIVLDRSRYGNHGAAQGSASSSGVTSLAINPAHVQALAHVVDAQGVRRLWGVYSGRLVPSTVL